jgi:hypothetical protein
MSRPAPSAMGIEVPVSSGGGRRAVRFCLLLKHGEQGGGHRHQAGQFHEAQNLYAVGPAVLPTLGSPSPMLSGVALARRTADHLVTPVAPPATAPGFRYLFDGIDKTFALWQKVGGGGFALIDGAILSQPDPSGQLGCCSMPARPSPPSGCG